MDDDDAVHLCHEHQTPAAVRDALARKVFGPEYATMDNKQLMPILNALKDKSPALETRIADNYNVGWGVLFTQDDEGDYPQAGVLGLSDMCKAVTPTSDQSLYLKALALWQGDAKAELAAAEEDE